MTTPQQVKDFIEEWVQLYPANAKFNGRLLRSRANDCVNKMIKLCKDNPKYTKDIIFAATKNYLQQQQRKQWAYTKQATYFISKIGEPSLLEQFCDEILNSNKAVELLEFDEGDLFI